MISLGAKATLGAAKGDRTVAARGVLRPAQVDVTRENVLAPAEFLKSIRVPAPKPGQKGAYVKLKERGAWDFAVVSAAVSGVVKDGVLTEITIVVGGSRPCPGG